MQGWASEVLRQRDSIKARHTGHFRRSWGSAVRALAIPLLLSALFVYGVLALDVSPQRLWNGLGEIVRIVSLMMPPEYGTQAKLLLYIGALAETVAIAFLGTLAAAILALPFGFLAARNVLPVWLLRFTIRRSFDTIRGVDTLIWALIWINVVGLGPFAGVLAIMTADIGAFGKLFSEAIETADRKPVEGVTASGGGALHRVRFGLVPEVLPVILSQVLYYFESNTRSATIIGIVGAGGIGLHLSEQIRTLEWNHVSFLVLLILAVVAIIDWVSSRLRFAIIGTRGA
jgi:phosphonate transport system permease protein